MNYTTLNSTDELFQIPDVNLTLWGLPFYFQRDTAEFVVFLTNGVLLCTVNIFGVFGNILSAFVLSRKKMQSPLNILILRLSVCDCIICLLHFLWFGVPVLLWRFRIGEWYIKLACSSFKYEIIIWGLGKLPYSYY